MFTALKKELSVNQEKANLFKNHRNVFQGLSLAQLKGFHSKLGKNLRKKEEKEREGAT